MTKEIYYFTGTGNSLAVARDLANKINGKIISIPSMMEKENITIDANMIGFVFPVYYATNGFSGIPLIVERFLNKLKDLDSKYIFSVCTHSGNPGDTVENLQEIINNRGGELAAGFTLKLFNPPSVFYKLKTAILRKELENQSNHEIQERQKELIENSKNKLDIIYGYISHKKKGLIETRSKFAKFLSALLLHLLIKPVFSRRYRKLSNSSNLKFKEMIPLADKSFQINENCNGCGICAKICPVNNIKIINNKPIWQHNCENCFACYVWCPQKAINGEIVSYNERYHHPDVKISDMVNNKIIKRS